MLQFFRFALLLALCLPAANALLAQNASSSSSLDPELAQNQPQDQAQPPAQAPPSSASQNPGSVSVQSRIRARRDQRRAQSIRDAYSHLYETYVGMGYLRFTPGPNLQRVTYYSWDAEFSRFFSERLGVTAGGRGYYGSPFVGLNFSSITRPAVSTYAVLGGPVYRFYLRPKASIGARAMGGWALGNFSSDTNGFGSQRLGMWPDGNTYAVSGGLIGEYNVSPGVSLRLAGEYFGTGFGSTIQHNVGFTSGFVYRFGRQ